MYQNEKQSFGRINIIIRSLVLLILLSVNFPFIVQAHSVLDSSNPRAGQIVKKPITEISLLFNTKVEKRSRFYVENNVDGEKVVPEQYILSRNKIVGIFRNPLKNGFYTLYWEIIGADGHPVEGNFPFQIDSGIAADNSFAENKDTIDANVKGKISKSDPQNSRKSPTENTGKILSPFIFGVIVVLFALAFVLLVWLLKKKE